MKFGVKISGTVEEAVRLDEKNGNSIWQDPINNDMKNSCIALELLERNGKPHVDYTEISYHLVFELNLYKTRKA